MKISRKQRNRHIEWTLKQYHYTRLTNFHISGLISPREVDLLDSLEELKAKLPVSTQTSAKPKVRRSRASQALSVLWAFLHGLAVW